MDQLYERLDRFYERLDPARAWLAVVATIVAVLGIGAALFPRRVYDGFLWRYFWGPVVADGNDGQCAVRRDGGTEILQTGCETAEGVVATPGYTTLSTVSYAIVLLLALVGVILLIRRLDIGTEPAGFYAMFPFVLFGGALRVVEDISVRLDPDAAVAVPFPWSALLISPFIYGTVFLVTLGAVLLGVALQRQGVVDRFQVATAAIGTGALAITLAYIGYVAVAGPEEAGIAITPSVPVITLGGAALLTAVSWVAIERYAPEINRGTGYMGALIIWGHCVDGIANVLSLDWHHAFGLPAYQPKHVVNTAIRDITAAIQPAWLSDAVGVAWPFIPVKLGAAIAIVWVFDDRIFEDSPRYALLLLITVLAIGLGPGTRDFLRATLGI